MPAVREIGRARARRVAALLAVFVAVVACGAPSGELPDAPAPQTLPGSAGLVLASAGAEPAELVALDLASRKRTRLQLPDDVDVVADAFWEDRGDSAIAIVLRGARVEVLRVALDAEPQTLAELGPERGFYDLQGTTLLASGCAPVRGLVAETDGSVRLADLGRNDNPQLLGEVKVVDVASGGRPVTVGAGCVAALSPDEEHVAHSPDGTTVWLTRADGSRSRRVFSLDDLDLEAVSATGASFQVVGPMRWSKSGIAFAIDAEGSDTIVKLRHDGSLAAVLPIRPRARDFAVNLEWDPAGEHLAIGASNRLAYVNVVGTLSLTGPSDEELDVLSVHAQSSDVVLWGPEGDEVLVAGPSESWIVTDLRGNWVQRVPVAELLPFDWRSE
jgi:hypothetical protein